jgi:hypothetical protein
MLGSDQTGTTRPPAAASLARSQDIYQRYAAGLYRQALLNLDGSAMAEYDVRDVIVNESALARVPERGEGDARYRLAQLAPLVRAVLSGLTQIRRGVRVRERWDSGGR